MGARLLTFGGILLTFRGVIIINMFQEYQEDQDQISGATYISDVVFLTNGLSFALCSQPFDAFSKIDNFSIISKLFFLISIGATKISEMQIHRPLIIFPRYIVHPYQPWQLPHHLCARISSGGIKLYSIGKARVEIECALG